VLNLKSHAKVIGLAAVATGLGSALAGSPAIAFSTTNVTGVTLGSFTDGADSTVNGITYRNQSLPITGVTAGNAWTESGGLSTELRLQRSTAGTASEIVWSERESGATNTQVRAAPPTTTQAALNQSNIFIGTDNLFANVGDPNGNNSNVERADFLISGGTGTTPEAGLGVVVFERGATNVHDPFTIAAITGIDASGNPTSFGSLFQVASGWGTTALRTTSQSPPASSTSPGYTVLREPPATTNSFTNTANINQNIGGVLIRLSDLVDPGTPTIFGYALFGNDTVVSGGCTADGLVNINNPACYPTATSGATGAGGIDLLAGNVGIVREVPVPPQFVGMILPAVLAAAGKVRSNKRKSQAVDHAAH
jgi:hypothetical protein